MSSLDDSINNIFHLFIIAFALGLDAFSVSLTIGLFNIRLRKIFYTSLLIGFFHALLPLIGMAIGHFLSIKLPFLTSTVGGFLLIFIGAYIVFTTFTMNEEKPLQITYVKLLTLSFIVSVDSFPVGLSIGMAHLETMLMIFLIGMISMLLAMIGMSIGKKVHGLFRSSSTIIGSILLFLIGIYVIF